MYLANRLKIKIVRIKTATEPFETARASGTSPSLLTFQIWTAKVSAGRNGFKKLVGLNGFQSV